MRSIAKVWILGCALAVLGMLVPAQPASAACGYLCDITLECPRCVQSSLPGVGCIDMAECVCIDENWCFLAAAETSDPVEEAFAAIFAPAEPASTPALPVSR